jgi:hypothetical protein
MVKVRCFKCGNAFQLTEQFIANALAAEEVAERPTHYLATCPHCRQAIKVPLRGVHLPPPEAPAETAGEQEAG